MCKGVVRNIVFLLQFITLFCVLNGYKCYTANCVSLLQCSSYMNLIEGTPKPLKRSIVEFLRAQQCGFEGGYPKVCCTSVPEDLQFSQTNTKPTTSRPNKHTVSTNKKTIVENFDAIDADDETRKKKIEQLNKDFLNSGLFDFMGYDLFRRRRRTQNNSGVDVEIR